MEKKTSLNVGLIIIAFILAIGFSMSGYFIGKSIERFKLMDRSVAVKGLAERVVEADTAVLNLYFTEVGNDLDALSIKMQKDKDIILNFLQKRGVDSKEIQVQALKINDKSARDYGDSDKKPQDRYILRNTITVTSANVDLISKIPEDIGDLLHQNIAVSTKAAYQFTKFTDIKTEMLAEATQNARKAADQFAKDSAAKVGAIKSANQGIFTITAKNFGSEERDYNEAESIEKKIRVVSTVTFSLENA